METNNFLRGSEWRKWDLHVHTPESRLSNNFGNDWDTFVKTLFTKAIEQEIAVIGLTDYYYIDGYKKIKEDYLTKIAKLRTLFDEKQIEKINSILVIPNLEFRINKLIIGSEKTLKWNKKVNFHVILSNQVSIEDIEENFINKLEFEDYGASTGQAQMKTLIKRNITTLGERLINEHKQFKDREPFIVGLLNASVDDKQIVEVLDSQKNIFDGKYLLCMPADEDLSIVDWNSQGHLARKVLIQKAHVIFSSNHGTRDFGLGLKHENREKYIEEFKSYKPCIWGSDAHTYDNLFIPNNANYTWIKADPTFEGFKQVIHEPELRVFIGEMPKKIELVNDNKEFFIDKIKINTTQNSNEWFDEIAEIPINNSLTTIIGNKGSGKSALADVIGMCGNANTSQFSFLNDDKFLTHKSCEKYSAKITYLDGFSNEKEFSQPYHNNLTPSKIVYLSQSFVKELCEDLSTSRLQDEIDRVIFSHIPREEQLGKHKLNDLLEIKTQNIDNQILEHKIKLNEINKLIDFLEQQLLKENKQRIENKLKEKKRQLESVIGDKPKQVKEPDSKLKADISHQLSTLKENKEKLSSASSKTQNELDVLVKENQEIVTIKDKIINLERNYETLKAYLDNNETLKKYSIKSDSLIHFKSDYVLLDSLQMKLNEQTKTKKEEKAQLLSSINNVNVQIKAITKGLSEKEKEYHNYIDSLEKWEKKKKEIQGEETAPDTIAFYQKQINRIDEEIPTELTTIKGNRDKVAEYLLDLILEKKIIYPSLYEYAKLHASEKALEFGIKTQEFIEFDSKLQFRNDFENKFLEYINQARKGTFYGKEEGSIQFNKIIKEIDLTNKSSILSLPESFIHALNFNIAENIENQLEIQLLSPFTRTDLYNFLFSFDYLETKFDITYAGGRIQNLSPGERGTLLLIFYLLIDQDRRPIIIDQPEENLDNETIYEKLVPFIKKVKEQRQIILVTHSPNLAVVCDSEQIIHAHIDKDNKNNVSYYLGSIEYPYIKRKALDILEGTEPAFRNRKEKYNIS